MPKPTPPPARPGFWRRLFATGLDPSSGLPTRVSNPPITSPTSPLTRPISVTSALDFYRTGQVSRDVLLSIPAFRRAHSLIAGVVGALPYWAYKDGQRLDRPFLTQPENERGYTRSVSWTRVASDLLLHAQALMVIDSRYSDGFPRSAHFVPFNDWSQDDATGVVTANGTKLDAAETLLFTAPLDGLLTAAYQTVAQLQRLRSTSAWYTSHPSAREYVTATDGQEPDEDDLALWLSKWDAAREQSVTGFLPSGLQLNQVEQMTPEQMALKGAQEWEVSEVSRLTGIDATWLSINVSTRTYSNIIDERRNLIDLVLVSYVQAIEQRLSLPDVTPQGTICRADLDVFLRSDQKTRFETYAIAIDKGIFSVDEVRALEQRTPLEALRAPVGTAAPGTEEAPNA